MLKIKYLRRKLTYLLSIALAITLLFFFCNREVFLVDNDQLYSYNIFFKEWVEMLERFFKTGELPFYNWDMHLGTDFYSSMALYVTGDLFAIPYVFLQKYLTVEVYLLMETVVCFYIAAISFQRLLVINNINKEYILLFVPLIFVFSGCSAIYIGRYMYFRFICFLPLLFIGYDNFRNEKKVLNFIAPMILLIITCYYLMIPTLVILFFYALSKEIHNSTSFKCIVKLFISTFTLIVMSLLIIGFFTIPVILTILNNPRIGDGNISLFFEGKVNLGLIMSWITPPSFIQIGNTANIYHSGGTGHQYWYSLFVGILPLASCLSLYSLKNKSYFISFIILLLLVYFVPFNSLMNGLSEPSLRWVPIFVFYILFLFSMSLEVVDKKIISKVSRYVMIFYLIILLILILYILSNNYSNYFPILLVTCISLAINFVIMYLVDTNTKYSLIINVIMLVVFYNYTLLIYSSGFYKHEDTLDQKVLEYIEDKDIDMMHRYYVDMTEDISPASALNLNRNLDYNFMTTCTYNSVYDTNIYKFMNLNNINWHIINFNNYDVMNVLGVKYFIVEDMQDLPAKGNFVYHSNINHLSIYENLNYKGFGFTNGIIKHTDEIENLNDFNDILFVDDKLIDVSNYSNLKYSKLEVLEKGANHLKGSINLASDNILFISIPNNKGWKVYVNGELTNPIDVNGGFMGIPIKAGNNNIELYFVSYGLKAGIISSLVGLILLGLLLIYNHKNTILKMQGCK